MRSGRLNGVPPRDHSGSALQSRRPQGNLVENITPLREETNKMNLFLVFFLLWPVFTQLMFRGENWSSPAV